jgi:hypothetical protein
MMASLNVFTFDRIWQLKNSILLDLKPVTTSWSLFMFFLLCVFAFAIRSGENSSEYSKIGWLSQSRHWSKAHVTQMVFTPKHCQSHGQGPNCAYAFHKLRNVSNICFSNLNAFEMRNSLLGYSSVVGSDAANIDGYRTIRIGSG